MFDIVHIQLTEPMKTQVEAIDRQHAGMLDLASKIINTIGMQEDVSQTKETLDFLVQYITTHFTDEEALQVASAYPGYAQHREIHNWFIHVIEDLQQRFESDYDVLVLQRELEDTVISWVTSHILDEDTQFAKHYRAYLQKGTEHGST